MSRQEIYDKCTVKITRPGYRHIDGCGVVRVEDDIVLGEKVLLPQEAIDAIIDCAVEEAVERMKGGEQE